MSARLLVALLCASAATARAQSLSDAEILGPPRGVELESVRVRFTHFDQEGRGFQSQADRPSVQAPGSESAEIEQPQLEVVARHGKFKHRLWVPVDVVTAASPDAIDVTTSASRTNEAASFDLATTYQASRVADVTLRAAFHLEEPFRSWMIGLGGKRAFADDNTVIAASINQVVDWLDRFDIRGSRQGRAYRSSTNVNLSVTQLLSPTTVAHLGYGGTVQLGELSNTWNAVPLADGMLGREYLPKLRHRHAFVGRLSQALPWNGAWKGFYRFYVDNWGILAHSFETQLYQRVGPLAYFRFNYRVHQQTSAEFFTVTGPTAPEAIRTADSDLAAFTAHTLGVLAAVDLKFVRYVKELHVDFGYEHYFRTNGLRVNIYTCAVGFRF